MQHRVRKIIGSLVAVLALSLAVAAPACVQANGYLQCVPFARMASGIQIFGDAWTWWGQATGRYPTGFSPQTGAVLVFKPTGSMTRGHVAVVSQVVTDRIIQISHANWSVIGGTRGQVERDVTVVDFSPAGDWSQVKVWYDPIRGLGKTVYPTYGFIYQTAQAIQAAQAGASGAAVAAVRSAAVTVAQTAIGRMTASAANPGAAPAQVLSQAAEGADRIAALIQGALNGQDVSDDQAAAAEAASAQAQDARRAR